MSKEKSYTGAKRRAILEQSGRAILEQREELYWSKEKSYTEQRGRAILVQREELCWSKEKNYTGTKRTSYTGAKRVIPEQSEELYWRRRDTGAKRRVILKQRGRGAKWKSYTGAKRKS